MKKSIEQRFREPIKFDGIIGRAEKGWQMMGEDISRFRTLSLFHQLILILILVGTGLVIGSLLINCIKWNLP